MEEGQRCTGQGQAELGQAGLGWATPRVEIPWHAQPQIGIKFAKQNTK
jgi:hypothetical protein